MDKNLVKVICNASLFGKKRMPGSAFDFGDNATVGLRVKRMEKTFNQASDHDFGVYLGQYPEYLGKFHVGTCEIMSFVPSMLASYDTLEELKQVWELD